MNILTWLKQFLITFIITFIVNAAVIYLYNLITAGAGHFEWHITFYFAFTLGILYPIINTRLLQEQKK